MIWKQTKCIKISKVKTVKELFDIGTNWHERKVSVSKIKSTKAITICNELDKRLDNIMKALEGASIVSSPEWYFDKKMKPFREIMREMCNTI